jgi:hypothetical protein
MTRLNPGDLFQFARRYRMDGGKLRRVRFVARAGVVDLELLVIVRTTVRDLGDGSKPVRLKILLRGVEEYRFQKRPSSTFGKADLAFGFFQGLIYVNLEPMILPKGEAPAIHDFRASDTYAASAELFWEEVLKPKVP